MNENKPIRATDHVVVAPETIDDGLESATPESVSHPGTPTWWRANTRDILVWVMIGAGATLIAQAIAAFIFVGLAVR